MSKAPPPRPTPSDFYLFREKSQEEVWERDVQGEEGEGSLPTLSSVLRDKESSPQQ